MQDIATDDAFLAADTGYNGTDNFLNDIATDDAFLLSDTQGGGMFDSTAGYDFSNWGEYGSGDYSSGDYSGEYDFMGGDTSGGNDYSGEYDSIY